MIIFGKSVFKSKENVEKCGVGLPIQLFPLAQVCDG